MNPSHKMARLAWTGTLGLAAILAGCQEPAPDVTGRPDADSGWVEISQNVSASYPALWEDGNKTPASGNLTVLPGSGEVFLVPMGTTGMYRSDDLGETWTRVADANVTGRLYGDFSVDMDPTTGGMLVGTINMKGVKDPVCAFRPRAGAPWTTFNNPGHDGWTWGMADWSSDEPSVFLLKEHHTPGHLWLSTDRGSSWKKLDFVARRVGVIDARTYVANTDDGMFLSLDAGLTWMRTAEFVTTAKTPVRFGRAFYWLTDKGVIVSLDNGGSWHRLGSEIAGALWGPYFGRNADEMMVVNREGFHITTNAARTWTKIADFYVPGEQDAESLDKTYNLQHPTASFGWDAKRGVIYAARMWWRAGRRVMPEAWTEP
jgi:hypothetical protein